MIRLIDYWAEWCHPCKIMAPIIEEVKAEMGDTLEVEEINVDEEPEKSQTAGVMSIPTYILEKDGEEIDRKIGSMPKEVLVDWIQKYI